jgi:prepilin-type N-terminal cleavage/methylation domain-containing protein
MKPNQRRNGFTLVELMIASAVSALLVLGLVSTFVQQRKSYKSMQLMTEMDQNIRVAMDVVCRDLRMAGHGMNVRAADYAAWLSWAGGITGAVQVTQGSSGAPDTLQIVGALDDAPGRLSAQAAIGATSIILGSGQGAAFNASDQRVIMVGKTETARITGMSGDTLTISTDASISGRGLRNPYPAGAPVELVKLVTYSIQNETYNYRLQ